MTTITAQTILRSRHAQRPEKILSTLLLRYPRPIHAEFMTHRVLSKNSASSRAIPVNKLIQDVLNDPFVPLHWGKNQKGMQAAEELTGNDLALAKQIWNSSRMWAIDHAKQLANIEAHKQIVNRILEPYSHITVLVSGTEWSNFLALRDHPDAEPHIQILAREVRRELEREDNVQTLYPGQWHMPFVTMADQVECRDSFRNSHLDRWITAEESYEGMISLAIKKSVACCASTSYKTVDGFDMTLEKAIELHDKLVGSTPLHASPAEHVAMVDNWTFEVRGENESTESDWEWATPKQHGNFQGFRQYRKMLPNESM